MDTGLILVIVGLVELTRRLGASGRLLIVLSLVIGVVLDVLYSLAQTPPVTYADWFSIGVHGLVSGLAACGIVDFVTNRFPKTGVQSTGETIVPPTGPATTTETIPAPVQ